MKIVFDKDWLETFTQKLSAADVVTFDVFDTAITRKVETPVDVFALAEKELIRAYGRRMRGFAMAREFAEEDARALLAAGKEDVSFDEIYAALSWRLPATSTLIIEAKRAEMNAERSVLFAVPEMLEAVRLTRAAGKRIFFVSDMYLGAAEITALLVGCGYPEDIPILVSSETRRTKATGRQWEVLRRHLQPNDRVLHIGDNPESDDVSPRKHGIDTLPFTKYRSPHRLGGPLNANILPFSFVSRSFGPFDVNGSERDEAVTFMRRFGETFGYVVLGSFINWLEQRVRQWGIRHVFFLARDGYLMQRAWDAVGCAERTGATSSYLYISRRVLMLAELAAAARHDALDDEILGPFADGGASIRQQIELIGGQGSNCFLSEARRIFGNLDAKLGWERVDEFKALIRRNIKAILPSLNTAEAATIGYFCQENVVGRDVAIVDAGWTGNTQRRLVQLLSSAGEQPNISGFYYGLCGEAQSCRSVSGWMEGAFQNDFLPYNENYGVQNCVGILENLHCSPEGTTRGYVLSGGRYVPTLANSPQEEAQFHALVEPFQSGALDAIQRAGSGELRALTIEAGLAAIQRVALSPTREEVRHLSKLIHSRDFDHTNFVEMVPSCQREDLDEMLSNKPPHSVDWPMAYLIHCKSLCESLEDHQLVARHFELVRWHLDVRTARVLR